MTGCVRRHRRLARGPGTLSASVEYATVLGCVLGSVLLIVSWSEALSLKTYRKHSKSTPNGYDACKLSA